MASILQVSVSVRDRIKIRVRVTVTVAESIHPAACHLERNVVVVVLMEGRRNKGLVACECYCSDKSHKFTFW